MWRSVEYKVSDCAVGNAEVCGGGEVVVELCIM
jgi:hypothetical protein